MARGVKNAAAAGAVADAGLELEPLAGSEPEPAPAPEPEPVAEKSTVTVFVPRAFKLNISHTEVVKFEEGMQEMAPELAGHWFVKANGVQVYNRK